MRCAVEAGYSHVGLRLVPATDVRSFAGGLDLRGILAALPPNAPLSLEIPMQSRAPPALERARLVLDLTRRFLSAST